MRTDGDSVQLKKRERYRSGYGAAPHSGDIKAVRSAGATLNVDASGVEGALIRDGEIIERRERDVEIGAFGQLERIEATARHIKQLIALDLAHGAQLARELVTRAKQRRLAVTATFGQTAELDRDQRRRA